MKKDHDQCIREPEAEILVLQLYCNDVAHATSLRGRLPELWSAYAHLLQKGTAPVSKRQQLSNSHAALH
jgi:hypothetical protein